MNLWEYIKQHTKRVDFGAISTVKPKACRSFDELVEIYRRDLTVTQSLIDCMAISMAVHIAIKLDNDPLWIYLVGAPSSGKSTLCELLASDEPNTRSLSKFTGLVSGSTPGSHLSPSLQNKCVVVKDGTLLIESTPGQLANVYGELRDIFDGSLEAHYRNGVTASFSGIYFSMVIGITEAVYSVNMSALGARFLHCRLETDRDIEITRNKSAVNSILTDSRKTQAEGEDEADHRSFPHQRQYTAGFLAHLHSRLRNEDLLRPEYDRERTETLIQALADVIACSRAKAATEGDKILYESVPESSTRLVKQLTKLALCLCYVLDTTRITRRIEDLITKVAVDSAHCRQYYVLRTVAKARGLNRQAISAATGIPLESCVQIIKELQSLSVVSEDFEEGRRGPGRKNKVVTCTPWVQNSFRFLIDLQESKDGEKTPTVQNKKTKIVRRKKRSFRKAT
jgi:hypothetical protein